jgi:metal-dependent amidase/aminoacylase/carboxypeptidase family protein
MAMSEPTATASPPTEVGADVDTIEIRLAGPGGHTARPHLTVDLAYVVARVVTDLPLTLGRLVDPRAKVNVTFGAIQAGAAPNVIPTAAVARGTVQAADPAVRATLPQLIERVVAATVAPFDATWQLTYQPAEVNEPPGRPVPMPLSA